MKISIRSIVNECLTCGLILVVWAIHVLFIGWWRYYTSKEVFVLNNEDDITSMKHTTHNRYVNNAIDGMVSRHSRSSGSLCPNPITVVCRESMFRLTTKWTISDETTKVTILGSKLTMMIYPL